MSTELVLAAADLYAFVEATEGKTPQGSARQRLERWATDLSERLSRAKAGASEELSRYADAAVEDLRGWLGEVSEGPRAAALRKRWRSLSRDYEALILQIRKARLPIPEGVTLGRVKPRNLYRNLFHVMTGTFGVALYELGLGRWSLVAVAGAILSVFVLMDVSRRVFPGFNSWYVDKIFGKIARPVDAHATPSSTWFVLGLLIATALYPKRAVEVGVLILAFGDPLASLVGKSVRSAKLYLDKSVAGTAAFFVVSFAVSLGFLFWVEPELGVAHIVLAAAGASVAGSLIELFSGRTVDDNFSIPIVAGGVAALLL